MGSGVSALCGNKRSVLIINSVRKLPPIPENEADSDFEPEVEIQSRSGKLHAAESRDSGIGENEIPNYIQRINGPGLLRNSSNESSPEKKREGESGHIGDEEMTSARPSRPHSCRLGHRGHPSSAKRTRRTEVSESQIRRMVKSGKRQSNNVQSFSINTVDKTFDLSDNDTLSNHSSSSPIREQRPKSAKRRHRRNAKSRDGRNSARNIRDLDTSTESDISDTDMLSIPDETGSFHRGNNNGEQRRGWVGNDEFTDIMVTSSRTPRAPGDFYRIVSGSFSDVDPNLSKTASERSISGVILTPVDGNSSTSTNLEWFDAPNDCLYHTEGVSAPLIERWHDKV